MANSDFLKGMAFMGGIAALAAGAYFAAKKYIEIHNDMAFECDCDCGDCGYDDCAGKAAFDDCAGECCCSDSEQAGTDLGQE